MSIQDVFAAVEKQIQGIPKSKVYVIEIESIPFKSITKELQAYFESFPSLQYLSLNNCSLESLENFPRLPALIRLDLISNNLAGDFSALKYSKYLQTLFLSANKISDFNSLDSLNFLKNLLQLDLIANPLTVEINYSEEIFKRFPSLKFLDSKDKNGKNSNDANMSESLQRVRPDLFQRGQSLVFPSIQETQEERKEESKQEKKIKKEVKTIKRTNSYKTKILNKEPRSISFKLGLTFPVSRIRRHLRQKVDVPKLSMTAAVYITTVLEYMCAEILEVAGNKAREKGFKRIMPRHLLQGIKHDLELKEFYENAIIPETEFISKLKLD